MFCLRIPTPYLARALHARRFALASFPPSVSFLRHAPLRHVKLIFIVTGATSVTTKAIQRAATIKQEESVDQESQRSMATGAPSLGSNNYTVNSSMMPGVSHDGASGGSINRDAN